MSAKAPPSLSRSQLAYLRSARKLARFMDAAIGVGRFRIGADAGIGFIPVVGDVIGTGVSAYFIWVGTQMGLPKHKIAHMVANASADFLMGLVPFLGDVSDMIFKSHMRNMRIIDEHVHRHHGPIDGVAQRDPIDGVASRR